MTKQELKNFIVNRKSELAKCQSFIDYLVFLYDENYITKTEKENMNKSLNLRYYYLAKSINDHEKLLTND